MIEQIFIDERGVPPTKAKAIARVLIVSIVPLLALPVATYEYVKALQMDGYQRVCGTIISSDLTIDTASSRRDAPYGVVFQAQFTHDGQTRIGATSPFGTLTSVAAEADARRRAHPVGTPVDVWFDPAKLPDITIDRPSPTGPAIAIGIIAAFWLFMTWIYFIPQLKRAWNPDVPKPLRLKLGLRLFVLAGFLVPAVASYFFFLKPLWTTISARGWTETPAQIIGVNTIENRHKLTTWKTDVLYSYEVNGDQFVSNLYAPTECAVPYEAPRRQAVSIYSPGQTVPCYVDPRDPARATLARHISPSIGIGVWVVMIVIAFGVGAFAPNLEKLDRIQIKSKKAILVISVMVLTVAAGTGIAVFAVP